MTWLKSTIIIFIYKIHSLFQARNAILNKIKEGYGTDLLNVNNQTNVCLEKMNTAMNFVK